MKKFVAIIMAILIMTSLCACGNTNSYAGTYEMDQEASHVAKLFCYKTEDFISCASALTLSKLEDGVGDVVCRATVTYWDNEVKVNSNVEEAYDNAMDAYSDIEDMLDGDFDYSEYMESLKEYSNAISEAVSYERVEKTAESVVFYGTYTLDENGDIVVTMNEDSNILYTIDDEYQVFTIDTNDGVLSFSFEDYGDLYEFVYK